MTILESFIPTSKVLPILICANKLLLSELTKVTMFFSSIPNLFKIEKSESFLFISSLFSLIKLKVSASTAESRSSSSIDTWLNKASLGDLESIFMLEKMVIEIRKMIPTKSRYKCLLG